MTVTIPSKNPLGRTRMTEVDLLHGDCIDVLRTLPAGSVDAVVTSPPYAMQRKSTYGGVPEKDYPEWTVVWMREVWRVLKDDGSVIINISPHIKNGELNMPHILAGDFLPSHIVNEHGDSPAGHDSLLM